MTDHLFVSFQERLVFGQLLQTDFDRDGESFLEAWPLRKSVEPLLNPGKFRKVNTGENWHTPESALRERERGMYPCSSTLTRNVGPAEGGNVCNGAFRPHQVFGTTFFSQVGVDGAPQPSTFVHVPVEGVGLRLGRVVVVGEVGGLALHGADAGVLEEELHTPASVRNAHVGGQSPLKKKPCETTPKIRTQTHTPTHTYPTVGHVEILCPWGVGDSSLPIVPVDEVLLDAPGLEKPDRRPVGEDVRQGRHAPIGIDGQKPRLLLLDTPHIDHLGLVLQPQLFQGDGHFVSIWSWRRVEDNV